MPCCSSPVLDARRNAGMMSSPDQSRSPADTPVPPLSLFLGYSPMLLLALAALATWLLPPVWNSGLGHAAVIWAGVILAFLAGVRRGLSFRQPGGPTFTQIATMFWLFVLAAAALLSPWPVVATILLLIGFLSTFVLDPVAARHDEVPSFFARLRPIQMLLPIGSLILLGAFFIRHV